VLTGTPKGVGPVVTGDVIEAGLRVDGAEVEEGKIKVAVKDRENTYEFAET
jgi:acylpyruvate hydrolase